MKIKWKLLVICLIIPLIVGGVSALLTRDGMQAFESVEKPPLTPPAIVFPIVWTLLYLSMGLASYLVVVSKQPQAKIDAALRIYGIQLAFNFFWSIFFFGLGAYLFSFLWLVALWVSILLNIVAFYRISKPAGLLLIPYLIWVTLAGYLNFSIYLLNM